jgi:hypothetical protein
MAVTVTEVGRKTDTTTNSTSNTVNFTGSVAAGRTIVVFANTPTGSTNAAFSVTDSKGNTYDTRRAVFGVTAHNPAVATSTLTTGVTASDTITITLSVNCSNWSVVILDLGAIGAYDISGSFASDGATHGDPSVVSVGNAAEDNQIVLAGFVNTNTTHTFTPGSGYTALSGGVVQTGTGSSARQLWVEYQEYTTGSGSPRTANGVYNTAATYSAVMVVITVSGGGGGGGGGSFPVEVGRRTDTTAATTKTISVAVAVPAGHLLAIMTDTPTASTNTSVTVTDSKSNTYTTRQARFEAVYSPAVATTVVSTGLTTSDTITVTLAVSCAAWALVAVDLGPATYDVSGSVAADGSTHATASVSSAAGTTSHQMAIAGFANSNTTHTFTPDTGWNLLPGGVVQANTGTNARQLWVVTREFSTGGGSVRTASGGYNTAAQYGAVIAVVNLAGAATFVSQFRAAGDTTWVDMERMARVGGVWV